MSTDETFHPVTGADFKRSCDWSDKTPNVVSEQLRKLKEQMDAVNAVPHGGNRCSKTLAAEQIAASLFGDKAVRLLDIKTAKGGTNKKSRWSPGYNIASLSNDDVATFGPSCTPLDIVRSLAGEGIDCTDYAARMNDAARTTWNG